MGLIPNFQQYHLALDERKHSNVGPKYMSLIPSASNVSKIQTAFARTMKEPMSMADR